MTKTMTKKTLLPLLLPLLWLAAPTRGQPAAPPASQPAPPAGGGVTHVVVLWLKAPADPRAAQKLIDATHALAAIPGVQGVRVGRMIPSPRPVVDSTFSVGLVMHFADVERMKAYLADPAHVKTLTETIKPLADHYTVYDFTDE